MDMKQEALNELPAIIRENLDETLRCSIRNDARPDVVMLIEVTEIDGYWEILLSMPGKTTRSINGQELARAAKAIGKGLTIV